MKLTPPLARTGPSRICLGENFRPRSTSAEENTTAPGRLRPPLVELLLPPPGAQTANPAVSTEPFSLGPMFSHPTSPEPSAPVFNCSPPPPVKSDLFEDGPVESLIHWKSQPPLWPAEGPTRHIVANSILSQIDIAASSSSRIVVRGDLDFAYRPALTSLPSSLYVDGNLILTGCRSLSRLPDNLHVTGSLHLNWCTNLAELPEGLVVGGDLVLSSCGSLRRLGENLSVGGNLDLSSSRFLGEAPSAPFFGGHLNIEGCLRITSLSPEVTTWGPCPNGKQRVINVLNSGISAEIQRQLERADAPGMRFLVFLSTGRQADRPFSTLKEAIGFWADLAPKKERFLRIDGWALPPSEADRLLQFLNRLCGTSDYKNLRVRPHLGARVEAILSLMQSSPSLRTQIFEDIGDALSSCDDRVASVMNRIELEGRVYQAERGLMNGDALQKLALGLMQLEIVHTHARQKVLQSKWIDEVEVFLAYEVGLVEVLDLPCTAQTMVFERCADVTPADLDAAKQAAQNAVQNSVQRAACLSNFVPYQRYLRREETIAWSWDALLPQPMPESLHLVNLRCPLTLNFFAELLQPLLWRQGNVYVAYEAAPLLQFYIAQGLEPTTRQPLSLDNLIRPLVLGGAARVA